MAQTKLAFWQKILSCTLVLALTDMAVVPPQSANAFDLLGRLRAAFSPPKKVGVARNRRSGAAVRDPDLCPSVAVPLTALVPDITTPVRTSAEYPLFWFYVPYSLNPSSSDASNSNALNSNAPNSNGDRPPIPTTYKLKFVLQDERYNDIYQTQFALPETTPPGVISLRLRSPKAALQVGKRYHWYFLIYCNDPNEIYEPAFVAGMVQRDDLSQEWQQKMMRSTLEERLLHYAEAGLWFDFLAAVEASRSQLSPTSTNDYWAQALQAIGLEENVRQQPIVGQYYVP